MHNVYFNCVMTVIDAIVLLAILIIINLTIIVYTHTVLLRHQLSFSNVHSVLTSAYKIQNFESIIQIIE